MWAKTHFGGFGKKIRFFCRFNIILSFMACFFFCKSPAPPHSQNTGTLMAPFLFFKRNGGLMKKVGFFFLRMGPSP